MNFYCISLFFLVSFAPLIITFPRWKRSFSLLHLIYFMCLCLCSAMYTMRSSQPLPPPPSRAINSTNYITHLRLAYFSCVFFSYGIRERLGVDDIFQNIFMSLLCKMRSTYTCLHGKWTFQVILFCRLPTTKFIL